MKEFLDHFMPNSHKYTQYILTNDEVDQLKALVVKSLNLRDMNQLRDRLDGVLFYRNFLLKSMPILALEKLLGIKLENWKTVDPKSFTPVIEMNNRRLQIISSHYGQIPLVQIQNTMPAIITSVELESRKVFICGYASDEVLNLYQDPKQNGGTVNQKNKAGFVGFNKLIKISSQNSLRELLN